MWRLSLISLLWWSHVYSVRFARNGDNVVLLCESRNGSNVVWRFHKTDNQLQSYCVINMVASPSQSWTTCMFNISNLAARFPDGSLVISDFDILEHVGFWRCDESNLTYEVHGEVHEFLEAGSQIIMTSGYSNLTKMIWTQLYNSRECTLKVDQMNLIDLHGCSFTNKSIVANLRNGTLTIMDFDVVNHEGRWSCEVEGVEGKMLSFTFYTLKGYIIPTFHEVSVVENGNSLKATCQIRNIYPTVCDPKYDTHCINSVDKYLRWFIKFPIRNGRIRSLKRWRQKLVSARNEDGSFIVNNTLALNFSLNELKQRNHFYICVYVNSAVDIFARIFPEDEEVKSKITDNFILFCVISAVLCVLKIGTTAFSCFWWKKKRELIRSMREEAAQDKKQEIQHQEKDLEDMDGTQN